jgi:aromatic-L-amino-acid/L-tryptophan decarboxylase
MIAEHLTTLPERPVFRPFPRELAAKYLDSKAPESGQEADDILAIFAREIQPYFFGKGHPRFYGWVNSPPVVLGIFAAAMNPSCAGGNHAAIYVEREQINWFKQIVGFPAESMGLLVSGGSIAASTGLVVARQAQCGFDIRTHGVQGTSAQLKFTALARDTATASLFLKCSTTMYSVFGIGSSRLPLSHPCGISASGSVRFSTC